MLTRHHTCVHRRTWICLSTSVPACRFWKIFEINDRTDTTVLQWSASGLGAQDLAEALSNSTKLSHLFVNGITVESCLSESGYEHVMLPLGAGEAPGAQLGEAVAGMQQLTHLYLGDFRVPDCSELCAQLAVLSTLQVNEPRPTVAYLIGNTISFRVPIPEWALPYTAVPWKINSVDRTPLHVVCNLQCGQLC